MNRTCDICGRECNERLMEPISYGRKTEWWCWECYKVSQQEANTSDRYRQQKLYKIQLGRKRHK